MKQNLFAIFVKRKTDCNLIHSHKFEQSRIAEPIIKCWLLYFCFTSTSCIIIKHNKNLWCDSQLGHTKDLKMVSAASLALTFSI